MTDGPMPFFAPMIVAMNDGRKTNTRRLLTLRGHRRFAEFGRSDTPGYDWHFRDAEKRWHDLRDDELRAKLPYAPGDRLWVKEDHWRYGFWAPIADRKAKGGAQKWAFGATRDDVLFEPPAGARNGFSRADKERTDMGWYKRLARFMPRALSRLTLIVEGVKVERLQDVCEEDAIAEGAPKLAINIDGELIAHDKGSARIGFIGIWRVLHGSDAWDANPWVVAIAFRVVRANIDAPDFADRLPLARASCTECNGTGLQSLGNGTVHGCVACYPQLLRSRFDDVHLDGCLTADQAHAIRRYKLQRDFDKA